MRLRFRLNSHYLVLAVIALLSFGAIVLKKSDQYLHLQVSAETRSVVIVNAANYQPGPVAPESLVATFGNNMSVETATSESPLTVLGGVGVEVIDSKDVRHDAQLLHVSPRQINYLMPAGVALGAARVVIKNDDIKNDDGTVGQGKVEIVESAPALFTAGADHKLAVGMTSDNGGEFTSILKSDGSAQPVSFGAPWRPNTLTVLGTGIRRASNLLVRFGDEEVQPTFVGPEGVVPGVDKVVFSVPTDARSGMTSLSLITNSQPSNTVQSSSAVQSSNTVQLLMQPEAAASATTLSAADVQTIIAQAVAKAQQIGFLATIAVVDKEGNVLGVFKMSGASSQVRIGSTDLLTGQPTKSSDEGLENVTLPLPGAPVGPLSDGAALAAISKAGTAAFFSTQGSAITTRTASFIIQENFPPTISSQAAGPLFGVQFSSLPCSDIKAPANLPLGLAGDPGGVGIYKDGVAVGGVGIEGDGFYSIDLKIMDFELLPEELCAIAAIKGYRPPPEIRIDTVLVDGMRLPYVNVPAPGDGPSPTPFGSLPGSVIPAFPIRGQLVSQFTPLTLGGIPGRVDPRFFPFKGSAVSSLTVDDVTRILTQAAQQAFRTRAAIRKPLGSPAEVNITVVDTSGVVLGIFSTKDAPIFGFDVSAQKARTAAFFSLSTAGAQLRAAGFERFVDPAATDGVLLDGKFAFTSRSVGFLARPFYPDGIPGTRNGPFSKPLNVWSPFNVGLQLALVKDALVSILTGGAPPSCTSNPNVPNGIPNLPHGIQIFAGSAPLFKNGALVGAIGISGDGIDQDDIIAAAGSFGFEAPAAARADQLTPRGVRLPFVKFPRSPNLRTSKPTVPFRSPLPSGNVN
ncbi:MAG: heme-binding protein [Blastocatellia bacterium]